MFPCILCLCYISNKTHTHTHTMQLWDKRELPCHDHFLLGGSSVVLNMRALSFC